MWLWLHVAGMFCPVLSFILLGGVIVDVLAAPPEAPRQTTGVASHVLSHLQRCSLSCCAAGVRARQEKVVFVCCEDEDTLREEVHPLLGETGAVLGAGVKFAWC